MSKSKGNVVVPTEVFERHSADAVRYWAASARLGFDAAIDEQQMKVGRRLAIKLLNASKFVLSFDGEPGEIVAPVDRSMLAGLRGVVHEATAAFEDYEHARALDLLERSFWGFTDDYLELVKQRAYGAHGAEGAASAVATLRRALDVLVRAFAPFLPYVTEEVWSWWREGSVHRTTWPTAEELHDAEGADPEVFAIAAEVLGAVRKEKALAKVSLKAPVRLVTVRDTAERLAKLRPDGSRPSRGRVDPGVRVRGGRDAVDRGRARTGRAVLMRYEDAVARLEARQPEHMPGPSLDRIAALVNYLDHPERTYPTIHVTGTNGKSTAARAAAAIACAERAPDGLLPLAAPARGDRTVLHLRRGHDPPRSSARRGSTSSPTSI